MPAFVLFGQAPDLAQPPAGAAPTPGVAGAPAPAGGAPVAKPPGHSEFLMMAVFGLALVMMIILPGRRQRKEQEAMLAALKKGAKVITVGGIIGTVASIEEKEDELTLRTGETKIKVTKSSVARVLGQEDSDAPKS
jgi:preprotein translocase subunit YajC